MEASNAVEGRQPVESNEMTGTARGRKKNDLNFGWFTLPPSSQEGRPASSGSNSERAKTKPEVPSETTFACGQISQGEPDPYNYYHDPDPAGGRSPTAQGGGDHRDLEGGGTPLAVPEHGEDACWQDASNAATGYGSEIIVDWPLSSVAMEQTQRLKLTRSGNEPRPPSTFTTRAPDVGHSNQVPPTPLPPISWQGYRESTRPTFRTWRDDWHTAHLGHQPPSDHNNNNSASASASLVDDCDGKQTPDLELDVEAMNIMHDQDDDHADSCTGTSDGPFNPKLGRSKVVPMKFKIPATKNATKPVYKSIPQVEERSLAPKRKSSIIATAKSLLKFSCWHEAKSGQVKLLACRKLAEEQSNDHDASVNGQRQTHTQHISHYNDDHK